MRPEAFRMWLAKLLVTVADPPDDDDGLSAAERAKAAAAWAMVQRRDGTWVIAGSMDDERGSRMDAAVTARAREIAHRRPRGERTITANDRAVAAFELMCGITLGGAGDGGAVAPVVGTDPTAALRTRTPAWPLTTTVGPEAAAPTATPAVGWIG